jgi:hypothetical protein
LSPPGGALLNKDEGRRKMKMKESKGRSMQFVNEAPAFAHDFPFSIRHFSFFISHPSSFFLASSFILS